MSKADELIAGLQTDVEFDSAGAFSLDREKARQKMRQFQLADPHRYVLLLVEAAALSGATKIKFEIDADDMRMSFNAALDWEDLDELYTSLFVDRTTVEIRARRELALACNAAMALNPRWIRIESRARQGEAAVVGVRGLLRPQEQDEIERVTEGPSAAALPSTEIHVKERFRPGLLVRFLHTIGDALPETELLRLRCGLASIPIHVNGRQVSSGLDLGLTAQVEFEAEGLRGIAGINVAQLDRSAMVLLSNGVEISTTDLTDSVPGLWFWVDSSRFRKDVSQAAVVRNDPSYDAMLSAVAKARDEVLGLLVTQWASGRFNDDPNLSDTQVFDLLRSCFLRWADANWLRDGAGPLGSLADMPLWRTVDERWLSPRILFADADPTRGVMYTSREFEGVQPLDWGPVIRVVDGQLELDAITRVYPNIAHDVTAQLEREVPWELNRRRWRARSHPPELPRGVDPEGTGRVIELDSDEFVGQVVGRPGRTSQIRFIIDGCLVWELEFELLSMGINAVIEGPFVPSQDYTRVVADRALASAAMLLLEQIPVLLARSDRHGGEELRHSLFALLRSNFPNNWLRAFGFEAEAAEQMLDQVEVPCLLPDFGLATGVPTSAARRLLFKTATDQTVTLVDIHRAREGRAGKPGKVVVVDRSAPLSLGLTELIVWVSGEERDLLARIFGRTQLQDDTAAYKRELGRRNFLAKPRIEPAVGPVTWRTTIGGDATASPAGSGIAGQVGINALELRNWDGSQPRRAKVELIVEDRRLTTLEEPSWVPGLVASLTWDAAPVNTTWDGLASSTAGSELAPLRSALSAGAIAILETVANEAIETGVRPDPETRRLLWLSMASPFISTEHASAWRRLRAEDEFDAAVEAYLDVLSLFPAISLTDVREGLALLLEAGRRPSRQALLELLSRRDPGVVGTHEFQRAVLERYPLFERVPLLEQCSGIPATLDELTHNFANTQEVAYVQDPAIQFETDEHLIVRSDPVDHVALLRLFPREAFKEVSAWIHERRHQAQFETKAALEHIRVPDRNRLVGVEFEHDGVTGELAIPPWAPNEAGIMKLVFCHQRRVVQEIEVHAKQPVIGILDDPKAPLSTDFQTVDVSASRMAELRKLLDKVLADQLLPALADAYPNLDARQRSIARDWMADHWRRSSPRAGQYCNRLSVAGHRFAELPLFMDIDQTPRSLAELSQRYAEQRTLWYVEADPRHEVAPPFPILWCRPGEGSLIRELFEACQDFSPRWEALVQGQARRAWARALPQPQPPPDALVVAKVDRHGLFGAVWLPGAAVFDSGIVLGSQGKVVTVADPVEMLPVLGVVDGVTTDDGFENLRMAGPESRYLDARAIFVYAELLNHHRRDVGRPERPAFHSPEVIRLRGLRLELLRRAAVALARARRHGVGMDAILRNLERRLEVEPLLELSSGRLISVDVARKARPSELMHLDIWEPGGPELDPSERARLLLGQELEAVSSVPSDPLEDSADEDSADEPAEPARVAPRLDELEQASQEFRESLLLPDPESIPEPMPVFEPKPDPVGVVLERIREELRLLREQHEIVLTEGQLDCISADRRNGRELVRIEEGVVFDSTHARFERAMIDPDPIWISFLASVAYTALNRWLEEVTDADELLFHHRHADHLLSGLLS